MARLVKLLVHLGPSLLLIAGGVAIGWALFAPSPSRTAQDVQRYHKGDSAPLVIGYDYYASPVTVLIFLSTHCRFCKDSIPFYQRLAALPTVQSGRARILGVFDEEESTASTYLAKAGLGKLTARQIDEDKWVPATPTLIVVRNTGTVELSAVGRLTGASEDSVLRLVTALAQ